MHLEGSTLLLNALGVESPPLISPCILSCISRSVRHIQKRVNLPNPRRPQESDTPSAQVPILGAKGQTVHEKMVGGGTPLYRLCAR